MPKQRQQVNTTGLRPVPLAPAARPVDTFVRTNAGANLEQLATALSSLEPGLARLSAGFQERQQVANAEQRAAGEKAFREQVQEHNKTYAQAVKDGMIPRGADPFFVAGFKEQAGRVSADQFYSDLRTALLTDEHLKEATDLKAYDDAIATYREQWMKEHVGENRDKFFEVGFGHRADAATANLRNEMASRVAQRVEEFSDDAHFSEVKTHVLSNLEGHTLDEIAADINQLNSDAIEHEHRNGAVVTRITTKAIVSAALQRAMDGDPQARTYLDLLKKVKGKTGALADTEYGSAALIKIGEEIDDHLWQANERARAQTAQDREERTRGALSQAIKDLSDNPSANLTKYVTQLKDVPGAAAELVQLQRSMNVLTFRTDEGVKQNLFSRIWTDSENPVTAQHIVHWMNTGKLETQDAAWLIGQVELRDSAARARFGTQDKLFDDFQFRQTLSGLEARFSDPVTGLIGADRADRAAYARAMLMMQWSSYAQGEGATATLQARQKWLTETSDAIVSHERGTESLSISPAPKPVLAPQDWTKETVVSATDVVRIVNEVKNGTYSPESLKLFSQWHITNGDDVVRFIRVQMRLNGMGRQNATQDSGTSKPE
jgi:hypothetical protein